MKLLKHYFSLSVIVIFFLMGIASSPSKGSMSVEKGQIPPDFRGYKGTLLIERQSKDWTKYAEKYFTENYTGPIKLIEDAAEMNAQYKDVKQYRFVLGRERFTEINRATDQHTASQNLCIIDRQTGRKYCTASTSFYGKLLKNYSAALERVRTE